LGLTGDDHLDGGGGDDLVYGGAGNDVLKSTGGYDRLDGADGDDRLVLAGTGGAVTGGNGADTLVVDLSTLSSPVTFNGVNSHGFIGHQTAIEDPIFLRDIEHLELAAGSGDDRVLGTVNDDGIHGLAGNDNLDGGGGNDFVYGGDGNDVLTSTNGFDRLDAGSGDDHVTLVGTGGTVTGGDGFDTLVIDLSTVSDAVTFNADHGHAFFGDSSEADNHIYFRNIEHLELTTGSSNDTLWGSAQSDYLNGGAGNDTLNGHLGADTLVGGAGADTFEWYEFAARSDNSIDHIVDFNTDDGDVISLRNFDSSSTMGIHDFASFMAAASDVEGGVFVSFDGDTNGIFIENISVANLSADDVTFT
jgi:Ca2+-binding RTX toxin-like protein